MGCRRAEECEVGAPKEWNIEGLRNGMWEPLRNGIWRG